MRADDEQTASSALRVAYLNTRYPAVSHTFIQREIDALRNVGVDVVPFSIRKPTVGELGAGADDREIDETFYILDGPLAVAGSFLRALFVRPLGVLRTLVTSQRLSPGGLGLRFRHFAYAIEAVRLAGEMRRRKLRHVHVHMANNGAMVALLAAACDRQVEYSLTVHGSDEFFDVHRLRLKEKAEAATFVRCISEFCRAQVMAWTDPDAWADFHVIHCGIPLENFAAVKRTADAEALQILTIGRLDPIKAFPVLFEALRRLQEREVPWSLRMIGDGPERERLVALARRLGIHAQVDFLGSIAPSGVPKELERAGLLVLPSCNEGLPVVLMEAMAAGVPVIATRVGGVAELVQDDITGRTVDAGSEDALTAALFEVWESPDEVSRRVEAAKEKVKVDFDVLDTSRALRDLFERYL